MTRDELRTQCEQAVAGNRSPSAIAFTLIGRSTRGWPVRPTVVDRYENGDKLYMFTVKQAKRLLEFLP